MTTKKTSKSTKSTKPTKTSTPKTSESHDFKTGFDESLDLGEALVREIDNIMTSKMPPQATGKILGEVVGGFNTQLQNLREKYSA